MYLKILFSWQTVPTYVFVFHHFKFSILDRKINGLKEFIYKSDFTYLCENRSKTAVKR